MRDHDESQGQYYALELEHRRHEEEKRMAQENEVIVDDDGNILISDNEKKIIQFLCELEKLIQKHNLLIVGEVSIVDNATTDVIAEEVHLDEIDGEFYYVMV
ncbi:MAG TPA: hypothetical protein VHZ76_00815 [Gammaproteobacteria bacterium]|jgi:hypothetical protein|nr:hypothetical protein [Gammaproteobacteria bacterium]